MDKLVLCKEIVLFCIVHSLSFVERFVLFQNVLYEVNILLRGLSSF